MKTGATFRRTAATALCTMLELCLLMGNFAIGCFCAVLAALGIGGRLADVSLAENRFLGLTFALLAGTAFANAGAAAASPHLSLGKRRSLPWRTLPSFAHAGNAGCIVIGFYAWVADPGDLAFGVSSESLMFWTYAIVNSAMISIRRRHAGTGS